MFSLIFLSETYINGANEPIWGEVIAKLSELYVLFFGVNNTDYIKTRILLKLLIVKFLTTGSQRNIPTELDIFRMHLRVFENIIV